MAKLTVVDAARVTGVSRSQLYRYIKSGKPSRTPEGLIDTAELLRAGLMLHVPPVPPTVPETHDATVPSVSPVPEAVSSVPSADTATLERLIDVLQRELDAAREREKLLTQMMHERETQLTQAAHERETLLLQLLAQMQQQNQRLLDMPTRFHRCLMPHPSPGPPPRPETSRAAPRDEPRGEMRRRIVELLRSIPKASRLPRSGACWAWTGSLADTCLGMRCYGLLQRVGRGKYVGAEPSHTNQP